MFVAGRYLSCTVLGSLFEGAAMGHLAEAEATARSSESQQERTRAEMGHSLLLDPQLMPPDTSSVPIHVIRQAASTALTAVLQARALQTRSDAPSTHDVLTLLTRAPLEPVPEDWTVPEDRPTPAAQLPEGQASLVDTRALQQHLMSVCAACAEPSRRIRCPRRLLLRYCAEGVSVPFKEGAAPRERIEEKAIATVDDEAIQVLLTHVQEQIDSGTLREVPDPSSLPHVRDTGNGSAEGPHKGAGLRR